MVKHCSVILVWPFCLKVHALSVHTARLELLLTRLLSNSKANQANTAINTLLEFSFMSGFVEVLRLQGLARRLRLNTCKHLHHLYVREMQRSLSPLNPLL